MAMASLKHSKTPPSSNNPSMAEKTFTSLGNLIRLLPTGTVFLYQFANPLLTNGGHCTITNKILSGLLISFCGLSCFFSTFTDSYTDKDGNTHYGFATIKGFWPCYSDSISVDFSTYKLQVGDFVHAFLSLIVFGVVSLLDSDTVECFYPSFESTQKVLLMTLPPIIGSVAGVVFVMFPNKRHGIGYPTTQANSSTNED